jgi:hypothetical protein
MTGDSLQPCHDDEEVLQLLRFSTLVGCLAAIEECKIANDQALMNEIYKRMRVDFGTAEEAH